MTATTTMTTATTTMTAAPPRGEAVRALHVALDVVGHCHGSACAELGRTRVVCAVRAPRQLVREYRGARGRVSCAVRFTPAGVAAATAQTTRHADDDDARARTLALALEGVAEQLVLLERLPQLHVDVVVEVVRDDGGVLDAACAAMAAALARGGVAMYELWGACGAGLVDGAVVADPTAAAARRARATVDVCVGLTSGAVAYVAHRGACEPATLAQLVDVATRGVLARRAAFLAQVRDAL